MRYLLGVIALFSTLTFAQTNKNLAGFQDIPWGSSVNEIKKKFPSIKSRDICRGLSKKEDVENAITFFKQTNGNCIIWEVENYRIDGLEFLVQFSLDSSARLKEVTIRKELTAAENPNFFNECSNAFDRMGSLLEIRYGKSFTPKNAISWYEAMGYQQSEVKIWGLGATVITLSNSWANKFLNNSICMMLVNYTPSKLAEASKL